MSALLSTSMQAATLYEAYGRQQQQQQQQQQHSATANGNQRVESACVLTPAAGHGPFALQPRGWAQQARDVTERLLLQAIPAAAPVHYQSAALQAEVRCAEALERAAAAGRGAGTAAAAPEDCDAAQAPPHPLVAAVCCQLLGELAELCGPLRGSLMRLRDALLPAIYSSCAAPGLPVPGSASGSSMRYDMLPWFALAGKLRADNNRLLQQQTAFTQELQQHAQHMTAVEQQLLAFQASLDAGSARAAALQSSNAALEACAAAASAEAAAAVAEASALRADVARLAAELDDARDQLLASKEEHSSEQEQLRAQLHAARQELVEGRQELVAALALAQAERQESERRAADTEQRSEALGQQLQDAQHAHADSARALQELQAAQAVLTPRPSAGDWGADAAPASRVAAVQHSSRVSTAQAVRQAADALAAQQRQVALMAALAAPDPPARKWQLTVEVPNVVSFLTELDGGDGDGDGEDGQQQQQQRHSQEAGAGAGAAAAAAQRLRLRSLGLGRNVPRFLRCPQPAVDVEAASLQQLEQQVATLWRERASYRAAHRSGSTCSLQAFVAQQFWAQAEAEAAAAAAAAAAVAAGADQLQEGQLPGTAAAPAAAPSAETIAAAAAAASYTFFHALCTHHRRGGSAPVQHMWRVLTGQQSEEDGKK